jgi:hypothetical protein
VHNPDLKRQAEKIGKSSFALPGVLDQRTEERARGVTIDIATSRFALATRLMVGASASFCRSIVRARLVGLGFVLGVLDGREFRQVRHSILPTADMPGSFLSVICRRYCGYPDVTTPLAEDEECRNIEGL